MPENERVICKSHAVVEREHGLRFALPELGERVTGFVVRYNGLVHAYVNQCAHLSVELDWNEGDFFDFSKSYVICATHGAQYQPETGRAYRPGGKHRAKYTARRRTFPTGPARPARPPGRGIG